MITFDEASEMLEDIAAELPKEIFTNLNGGINLLPDTKKHPADVANNLFILGEYHVNSQLGRFINIYYGSFVQLYASLEPEKQRERLKGILTHEFTHHLESMAGENDLVIQDAREIEMYRQQ